MRIFLISLVALTMCACGQNAVNTPASPDVSVAVAPAQSDPMDASTKAFIAANDRQTNAWLKAVDEDTKCAAAIAKAASQIEKKGAELQQWSEDLARQQRELDMREAAFDKRQEGTGNDVGFIYAGDTSSALPTTVKSLAQMKPKASPKLVNGTVGAVVK